MKLLGITSMYGYEAIPAAPIIPNELKMFDPMTFPIAISV